MAAIGRFATGYVAILVIALYTVLSGMAAPMAAGSNGDTLAVICSGAVVNHAGDPSTPSPTPGTACDHCTLCSATPPPAATLDNILAGQLTPVKLLRVATPAPAVPRADAAANPRQPQGPPSNA